MIIQDHVPYKFFHHGVWYVAYDQLGKTLKTLSEDIKKKHKSFEEDKSKSKYYFYLILSLENSFSRMLLEGRSAGSITVLEEEKLQKKEVA